MKEFASGAEAVMIETRHDGKPALTKRRGAKAYRHPQLDVKLRKQRTRREAKLLREAKLKKVPVPELYGESEFELVEEKVDGKLLRLALATGKTGAAEVAESGHALALLHHAGIVHGDYSTSNILVNDKTITIIDFGLASFSNEVEKRAEDVLLFRKSLETREKELFPRFWSAYAQGLGEENARLVEGRVDAIVSRGRYQQR